ncbi:MAG: hypothetical protein ACUVYA_06655, partial [Planctomycetota bacterium]
MVRALGSVASAFFLSALCASCRYPVEIRTEPPGAEVVVEALGPSGQPQVELPGTQITPAKYDLDFDAFSEYQATVSKSDYMDEKVKLTKAMLRALPRDPDGTYVATVKLKQYREVKTPQVVVDPREGLKVLVREVRAFPEDIEREGAAASKIVSLGEGLSVTGIALSPDGKHIAFSALETLKDSGSNQVQMLATLRAVASEGGGIAQLTTGSWLDVDPSFDRTGRMVYFVSNRLRSDGLD